MTSKTLGTITQTVAGDSKVALAAISNIQKRLSSPRYSMEQKQQLIYKFEDILNSLAGTIGSISDKETVTAIQNGCAEVVDQVTKLELNIFLDNSLLPKSIGEEVSTRNIIAKKLYPKTESRTISDVFFDPITGDTKVKGPEGETITGGTTGISGTGASSVSSGSISKPIGEGLAGIPEKFTQIETVTGIDEIDTAAAVLSGAVDILADGTIITPTATTTPQKDQTKTKIFQAGTSGINAINPTNLPTSTSLLSNQKIDPSAAQPTAATSSISPAPSTIELAPENISYTNPLFGSDISVSAKEIDPNFDELDVEAKAAADSFANTPATKMGETLPLIIPKPLLNILEDFGEDGNSYESEVSQKLNKNPIRETITKAQSSLLYYSENNFANLDSAMIVVDSDPSLATEYSNFKSSIGGGDGLSGAASYFDALLEHTDRISGLKVENNNELAEKRDDSTEYTVLNDITSGTDVIITSFNTKKVRSAVYYIQASAGIEQQLTNLSVIHDGGVVYVRNTNINYSIDPYVTYKCNVDNETVNLIANTILSNTSIILTGNKIKLAQAIKTNPNMTNYKILGNAKKLNEFYQTDKDYITPQTSSMSSGSAVSIIQESITKTIEYTQGFQFSALSLQAKKDYLNAQANTINTNKSSIKESIESDLVEFDTQSKKVAALEYGVLISTVYEQKNCKALLDVILKENVRESIQ